MMDRWNNPGTVLIFHVRIGSDRIGSTAERYIFLVVLTTSY